MMKELWTGRELLIELVSKELKIRYARSALRFFWAFLLPCFTVLIFYLFFIKFLKMQISEAPGLLYLMSAVFPWRFFQDSVMGSAESLVSSKNLIKESRFPHYFIPVSITLVNVVTFMPSLVVMIIIFLFVLKGLPVFILFLPFVFLIHLGITVGLSMIVSVLYVRLRDLKYILEVCFLLLFYCTPAFYSIYLVKDSFPRHLFFLYTLNPFTGILNLYRVVLLKGFYGAVRSDLGVFALVVSPVVSTLVVLTVAFAYYKRNKNTINDHLFY